MWWIAVAALLQIAIAGDTPADTGLAMGVSVKLTPSTSATFLGDPVKVTYEITNRSDAPIAAVFDSIGPITAVEVFGPGGLSVLRPPSAWWMMGGSPADRRTIDVHAGHSIPVTIDLDRRAVFDKPGTYSIRVYNPLGQAPTYPIQPDTDDPRWASTDLVIREPDRASTARQIQGPPRKRAAVLSKSPRPKATDELLTMYQQIGAENDRLMVLTILYNRMPAHRDLPRWAMPQTTKPMRPHAWRPRHTKPMLAIARQRLARPPGSGDYRRWQTLSANILARYGSAEDVPALLVALQVALREPVEHRTKYAIAQATWSVERGVPDAATSDVRLFLKLDGLKRDADPPTDFDATLLAGLKSHNLNVAALVLDMIRLDSAVAGRCRWCTTSSGRCRS